MSKKEIEDMRKFVKQTEAFLKRHKVISRKAMLLEAHGAPGAKRVRMQADKLGLGDMDGTGFGDLFKFFKKAGRFLRKHKVISKSASILSTLGVPFAGTVGKVANVAGFGPRRPMRRRAGRGRGRGPGRA